MIPDKQGRRSFLKTFGSIGVGATVASLGRESTARTTATESVAGLTSPALDRVRTAVIGLGARGSFHVKLLLALEGVEVTALCDSYAAAADQSAAVCEKAGRARPAVYSRDGDDYRRLLERDDIDAVFIATPWRLHTPMAVHTMEAGKHAFVEVPAAVTMEECWQLVDTAESTRRHCMMLENVCYGREELMVLNMCRSGLFGELTHGEGAYIHDLREQMLDVERGTGSWRTIHHTERDGNIYPTHGLGPIAQYMSINRGDRFDYLVSMSSPALGRAEYAQQHFPSDHPRNQVEYRLGDMNTSLIQTARGRSIMVQHDTTTPRPYNRINLIQGTRGTFAGYPDRITVEGRGETHDWQDLDSYREEFEHPLWKRVGDVATKTGGHGGMDFVMLWRLIYCLQQGEPLDQDVYDAASWSAISPASELSVAGRSRPVDVPDFTRGGWEKTPPLGIVS